MDAAGNGRWKNGKMHMEQGCSKYTKVIYTSYIASMCSCIYTAVYIYSCIYY